MTLSEKSHRIGGIMGTWKQDVIAAIGELIGTVIFLLFGLGGVQACTANTARFSSGSSSTATSDAETLLTYFYISASFGISLIATASVFYRFTGSIFNPSVTLALCLIGTVKPMRFVLVCTAQMVGAIVAAAILDALTPSSLGVGVYLRQNTNRAQGLFIEMFATAALTLCVLMLAAEKHELTPIAPVLFGLMLFGVMLFSTEFTGGAVNTARAFGPACIEGFPDYHWIYWLGPTLGALLATGFYVFFKKVKYWEITPGQESTDPSQAPQPV